MTPGRNVPLARQATSRNYRSLIAKNPTPKYPKDTCSANEGFYSLLLPLWMGPRTIYVDSREHLRSGPGYDPPRKCVENSDLTEKDFHEVCLEIQCSRTPFGDYLYEDSVDVPSNERIN